jgi:hypothetical protein
MQRSATRTELLPSPCGFAWMVAGFGDQFNAYSGRRIMNDTGDAQPELDGSIKPEITEDQTAVLSSIGGALLATQTTERMISLCLTHILQLDGPLTLGTLERTKTRKRTLGQILERMRDQIDLEDRFDAILSEFLESRNLLAHRLSDVPGWGLNDPAGIASAHRFLNRLFALNNKITGTFGGLARAWARANGYPLFPEIHGSDEAEKIVNFIFFKKDCSM